MWLDLKDVIGIPGAQARFDFQMDGDELEIPGIVGFSAPMSARGAVVNTAGVLTLKGELDADMLCVCDRCGKQFSKRKTMELNIPLAADMEDEDDPDIFPVTGDGIDLKELLSTCFILDMDSKLLCSEDCKGLCPICGKNLNDGPCSCVKPTDPRLAVLGQLLDIDNDK
jgi:uncharacterized protein